MASQIDCVAGADYGIGIDTLGPRARGCGIVFDPPSEVAQVSGQEVAASLKMVRDQSDFESSLGISGDVGASFGLYGGSAKVDFSKNTKFQDYSVFLIARVTVTNNAKQIRNPRYNTNAINLLQTSKEQQFREQYGDNFVLQILTGGEYAAIIEIHSHSDEEKNSISQTFEAHGGFCGLGAKAGESISKAFSDSHSHFETSVASMMIGGVGATTEKDPDAVVARLQNFAAQCTGSQAVVYSMFTQDYSILDLPKMPNYMDLQKAKYALRRCNELRRQLETLSNKVDYILEHPDQFVTPEKFGLDALSKRIADELNAVYDAASRCIDNPLDCKIPDVAIPDSKLPSRKPPVVTLKPIQIRPPAAYGLSKYMPAVHTAPPPVVHLPPRIH